MVIKKGYADTSFGQIHYRITPPREGVPIVLLHQTASSSAMFEQVMERTGNHYQLFAPDTPGFGNSSPLEQVSMAGYAEAIWEAMQMVGIGECWLFGHHTGAAIAVQLATDHPSLARKMILSGPPLLSDEVKGKLAKTLTSPTLERDGSHWNRTWSRIQNRFPDAPLDLIHRETMLSVLAAESYPAAYEAVFDQDFAGQLSRLSLPILLMTGEHDTLRSSLEPAFDLLKNGEMRIIPDAGTYVCDTNPHEIAEILQKFFSPRS